MIVIVNYGVGNLTSIKNMMKKAGEEAVISSEAEVIAKATKLILPGVGAFDNGISNLRAAPYFSILERKVLVDKTPVLCICLGVQLLTASSEEGKLQGLGWIKGKVVKFNTAEMDNSSLKIPHMGWSEVRINKPSKLFTGMHSDPRFYFTHSYHVVCEDATDELVSAEYGYSFTAGIEHENIVGVQFHPEKSHKFGLRMFENFIKSY